MELIQSTRVTYSKKKILVEVLADLPAAGGPRSRCLQPVRGEGYEPVPMVGRANAARTYFQWLNGLRRTRDASDQVWISTSD